MGERRTEFRFLVDVAASARISRHPRRIELGGPRGHVNLGGEQLGRHLLRSSFLNNSILTVY